ncbi:MAG: hypothetical protein N3D84_03595 [Candidatus Woesearchaeota archaeon]|nr:hypothetical protein [Candidatus Woesearchaeota archaeon]
MPDILTSGSGASKEEKKHIGFGGALFGKHETEVPSVNLMDISNQLNNLSRRLRILEERHTIIRKNAQLTDQTIIKLNKEIKNELSAIHSDFAELRRDFLDLKEKVKLIVKELIECAKTEDVKILEKYINIWDPIKFVTRSEVEKIVSDIVEERLSRGKQEEQG